MRSSPHSICSHRYTSLRNEVSYVEREGPDFPLFWIQIFRQLDRKKSSC